MSSVTLACVMHEIRVLTKSNSLLWEQEAESSNLSSPTSICEVDLSRIGLRVLIVPGFMCIVWISDILEVAHDHGEDQSNSDSQNRYRRSEHEAPSYFINLIHKPALVRDILEIYPAGIDGLYNINGRH